MSDPSIPLRRGWGRPCKPGGRGGQSHHAQVQRKSAGNFLLRADVLDELFSGACTVFGAQVETVGGAFEETRRCVVVISVPKVMHCEFFLVRAFVA